LGNTPEDEHRVRNDLASDVHCCHSIGQQAQSHRRINTQSNPQPRRSPAAARTNTIYRLRLIYFGSAEEPALMWRIDQRKNLCSTNLRFGAYSASSAWVLYPPASSAVRPNLDPIGPLTSLVQTHHHATSSSALELRLVFSAHRLYSTVFAKGTYGGIEQCHSVCRPLLSHDAGIWCFLQASEPPSCCADGFGERFRAGSITASSISLRRYACI
jgi:hypothetical protein